MKIYETYEQAGWEQFTIGFYSTKALAEAEAEKWNKKYPNSCIKRCVREHTLDSVIEKV